MAKEKRDKIRKKYQKKKRKEQRTRNRIRALQFGPGTFSLQDVIQGYLNEANKNTKHGLLARKFIAYGILKWQFEEFEFALYRVVSEELPSLIQDFSKYDVEKITYGSMIEHLKKYGNLSEDLKSKLGRYRVYRNEAFHFNPDSWENKSYTNEKWWEEKEKWMQKVNDLHVDLFQIFNALFVVLIVVSNTDFKVHSQYGTQAMFKDYLPKVFDAFGLPYNRQEKRFILSQAKMHIKKR